MAQVKIGWNELTESEQYFFVRFIILSMTGNPDYPTPTPALAAIGVLNEDYADKLTAARAGGVAQTVAKNEANTALKDAVTQLSYYVQSASAGQASKILNSGFGIRKPASANNLGQVVNVSAVPGPNPGQVQLRWAPVKHRSVYVVQIFASPGTDGNGVALPPQWITLTTCTPTEFLAVGLPVNTTQRFRIYATNANGDGPFSQTVQATVPA